MRVLTIPGPLGEIALIDGVLPTSTEWQAIIRRDVIVNVLRMPDSSPTLSGLLPEGKHLRRLTINSATCTDLSAVDDMSRLEMLHVGGVVTRAPSLERSSLVDFGGPVEQFPAVLQLPTLRRLRFDLPREPLEVRSPVEELTITNSRRIVHLPALHSPEALKRLTIHGAHRFDLTDLDPCVNLETLHFEDCRSLVGAQTLVDLTRLRQLSLESTGSIEPLAPLVAIGADVIVIGRNPFDRRFREQAGTNWRFPPGLRYLPD